MDFGYLAFSGKGRLVHSLQSCARVEKIHLLFGKRSRLVGVSDDALLAN